MPIFNKRITEREKAVLYYHVFADVDDWRLLYKLADPSTDGQTEPKFLDVYTSKWKNSEKVKKALQEIIKQKADNDAEERNKGREEERKRREESERTETENDNEKQIKIDYSDPRNRQRLYNEVIASSKNDPKTQLDAAKMFEQIQKDDREAAKAQKQTRVYLPIRCESCPLYLKKVTK